MSAEVMKSAPRIVVGVDGSPSSREALRWAVRQAALTAGTVDAVIAWDIPVLVQGYGWVPLGVEELGDFEAEAKKTIEAVIGEEVEPGDQHLVTSRVVNGHPAQVLLDAASGADLLVVGSRGHGAFAEALLGSVGQYCVHHAHCPVLIIRGEPAQAAA
ncbi:MAG TPA: universal stress protein [Streptosporangiaceae bacterium]|jgi:nucleotide-binding universal stress UspA family protein|nr:universal stress protein [Streptosporangiaceae bacterium]